MVDGSEKNLTMVDGSVPDFNLPWQTNDPSPSSDDDSLAYVVRSVFMNA